MKRVKIVLLVFVLIAVLAITAFAKAYYRESPSRGVSIGTAHFGIGVIDFAPNDNVPMGVQHDSKMDLITNENPDSKDIPWMFVSEYHGDSEVPSIGERLLEDEQYTGAGDYNRSFSSDSSDGNRIVILLRNDGDQELILNVSWTGTTGLEYQYKVVHVPADRVRGLTFALESADGIDGTWCMNATNVSGETIQLEASALQYQVDS